MRVILAVKLQQICPSYQHNHPGGSFQIPNSTGRLTKWTAFPCIKKKILQKENERLQ